MGGPRGRGAMIALFYQRVHCPLLNAHQRLPESRHERQSLPVTDASWSLPAVMS